jgi:hypothetical protein
MVYERKHMLNLTHVLMLLMLSGVPEDVVRVSAHVDAETLVVGNEYKIVFEAQFKDGWSGGKAGISAPFLQIDVPSSIELTGRELKTFKELSRNDFIQEPYERLVRESPLEVGFKLIKKPDPNEPFGLNFVTYASPASGDDAHFIRRRLSLPVAPKATAESVEPTLSNWGPDGLLQIGDKAAPFSLPQADGKKVALGQYLGKKNVVVTTYRAHW